MRSFSVLPLAVLLVLGLTWTQLADAVSSIQRDEAHLIRSGKDKCGKIMDADDCDDEDECSWCKSAFNGKDGKAMGMCFDLDAAKFLPPMIFKCDKTEDDDDSFRTKDDKMCSMIFDAKDCDDKDECNWCKTAFNAMDIGTCYSLGSSKFLPPMIYKCDKTEDAEEAEDELTKGVKCTKIKDKDDCDDEDECNWCTTTVSKEGKVFGMCVTADAAKLLPPVLFKCDKPTDDDEEFVMVADEQTTDVACTKIKDTDECDDDDECNWCKTTFNVNHGKPLSMCVGMNASKILPPLLFECDKKAEDDERVVAELTKAVKCTKIDEADDCDDEDDCTWCKTSFNGMKAMGMCVTVDAAKFLPPMAFKCDKTEEAANDDCTDREKAACQDTCIWCTSAAVGGGCFTPEEAAKLPAAIFDCKNAL